MSDDEYTSTMRSAGQLAFDRWLAAHDAQVKAEAWDMGAAAKCGMDKTPGPRTRIGGPNE